ncbi:MAG: DUF968 domain-containing protein [Sulfurimonas sp.]|nr:DUF968 domain-containing protein [Sulfurimonas sp.]
MKNKEYLKSFGDKECSFCHTSPCEPHHLRMAGVTGTGLKAPDYMAIPICRSCHEDCHNGAINKQWQIEKLFQFYVNELGESVGEGQAVKSLAKACYEVVHGGS